MQEKEKEFAVAVEAPVTTQSNYDLPVEQSFEFMFPTEPLDFSLAQEQAYKNRLHRFETARNMYQWELVSVKAANAATARAKKKYSTSG